VISREAPELMREAQLHHQDEQGDRSRDANRYERLEIEHGQEIEGAAEEPDEAPRHGCFDASVSQKVRPEETCDSQATDPANGSDLFPYRCPPVYLMRPKPSSCRRRFRTWLRLSNSATSRPCRAPLLPAGLSCRRGIQGASSEALHW